MGRGMRKITVSTKPKKKVSNPTEEVRLDLVGLELEALSIMLHHWATPEGVVKRKDEWGDKMPAFRKAVIAGRYTGARRKIEPEMIKAEFWCSKRAVEYVDSERKRNCEKLKTENDLKTLQIPYQVSESFTFPRPFPVPEQNLRQVWNAIINRNNNFDIVARKMLSSRFDIVDKTVKRYLNDNEIRDFKPSENQELLMGVFFDICSDFENKNKWDKFKAKILCALYYSKPRFRIMLIYYLVQTAHRLNKKIFVGEYEPKLVNDLCKKVCPKIEKINYQPFIRLVSAE